MNSETINIMQVIDRITIGVDVGRVKDYSAVAIIGRSWQKDTRENLFKMYNCLDLIRPKLGTPYSEVEDIICSIWERPEVFSKKRDLIVDQTGIGDSIVQGLRSRHVRTIGIIITGGENITHPRGDQWNVPKSHLVTSLVTVSQRGRFKVDPQIADAKEFQTQLEAFGYAINKERGTVSYESMSIKVHDDLVTAASLAIWYAETQTFDHGPGGGRRPDTAPTHDPFSKD